MEVGCPAIQVVRRRHTPDPVVQLRGAVGIVDDQGAELDSYRFQQFCTEVRQFPQDPRWDLGAVLGDEFTQAEVRCQPIRTVYHWWVESIPPAACGPALRAA